MRIPSAAGIINAILRGTFRSAGLCLGQACAQPIIFRDRSQENKRKLDKQIDQLLDRFVESGNPSVVPAYEKRISKLERKEGLAEKQPATRCNLQYSREAAFEHAL